MRILIFTGALYMGGGETVVRMLANGYVSRGHEVGIVSDQPVSQIDRTTVFLDKEIKFYSPIYPDAPQCKSRIMGPILFWKNNYVHIKGIIDDFKPDIIMTHLMMLSGKLILYCKSSGVPIIACEHSAVNRRYEKKFERYRKISYPLANAVSVLTKKDMSLWARHKNVVYMPNPIKLNNDTTPTEREQIVLAAGRIGGWEVKGFDTLIKVWSKLESKHPDWKLVIAGTGDQESFDYLKGLCKEYGCRNIEFPGQIINLAEYMRNVSMFIMTSRFEGFPIVLTEALGAECACISFDCDNGPRELIENGVSGILVENQNEEKMTEELDRLINDKDLRKRLSTNARSSIQVYDYDKILDRWENLFKTVIEKKNLKHFRSM